MNFQRFTTMQDLLARYETRQKQSTISLLEKEQEVNRLRIRQQEQEIMRRDLVDDQHRQQILLFERDGRIKELLLRQKTDSLHVQNLENRALADNNTLLREGASRRQFERNAVMVVLLLVAALSFLLVRRVQGKRRETQLLAEALDHKARAARADAIRAHAEALQREHASQAQYTRQLIQSQEDERRRLSRELHDGLGQNLTVLRNSALLGLRSDNVDVMRRQLEGISGMIADTIDEVRSMTRDLRPVQLEHLGLTGTLRGILTRIAEETTLDVTYEIDDVDGMFRPDDEINVFRLVQEAMSNMLRHAQAGSAHVRIAQENSHVEITVHDDGIGFNPHALDIRSGLGIRGMHERVAMLNGTLAIDSAPRRGTRVHIRLPIDR
jgi:signal transduction histidine kinase